MKAPFHDVESKATNISGCLKAAVTDIHSNRQEIKKNRFSPAPVKLI